MISLCMIVKNEEENLKICLEKISKYINEIIVVDTGSEDNTKLIARDFTDKVFDYKWSNDFAATRNFSISKSSNDWILVLDADELIQEFNIEKVHDFIEKKENLVKVGRIKRINFMENVNGDGKYVERVNRLFNKNNFKYEGIIHEQLISVVGETYKTENVEISSDHIGYTKYNLVKTNKLNRNIELLSKALKINSRDSYLYYQLGKSYYMLKMYEIAVVNFEKSLECGVDFKLEYSEDLIETYGYSLVNLAKYDKALKLENYLSINNNSDFNFLMGIIYMNNSKLSKAVEYFIKATEFHECKVQGVNSYLALYNIGVIYEVLGYKEIANEYYSKCGSYKPALKRIKNNN
ncbi:glycosyltransferase [Clostridium intestinale]|uniref:glycosyltransferase n=1 Tax=Clostridium intestinale TaxID=36845 RepID=UPI0028E455BB|nr:glycosyltransferase [Clostridium intestinale]